MFEVYINLIGKPIGSLVFLPLGPAAPGGAKITSEKGVRNVYELNWQLYRFVGFFSRMGQEAPGGTKNRI